MSAHQPVTIPAHELKGKMTKGKMRIQHVANMNIVFKYLNMCNVPLVGIGPQDIVDGNPKVDVWLGWFARGGGGASLALAPNRRATDDVVMKPRSPRPCSTLAVLRGRGRFLSPADLEARARDELVEHRLLPR